MKSIYLLKNIYILLLDKTSQEKNAIQNANEDSLVLG